MNRFLEEDGQGMVEYALIIALIAVVCIAAFTIIGQSVKNKAEDVNTGLGGDGSTKAADRQVTKAG